VTLAEEAIQEIHDRIGTVVGRKYRLDRLLGIGGMAAVFEASHRNGSRVALKVLHAELARLPELRARFLREGKVANRIQHTGVARIIDDDDDGQNTVYLVIELLDGETLDARRERCGGRLPLAEVLAHGDRVLDVLSAAHEQGIVHRDIKPENLFLTSHGELKVLDFGIARMLDGTGATRSGQLLGTPAFMAPEQANGRIREIDARTDIWAVGAVLFLLITGSPVHEAATDAEQLIFAATQPARAIETVAPWLGREVATAINRALAFYRDSRWPDARSMQATLRRSMATTHGDSSGSGTVAVSPLASAPTVDMQHGFHAETLPHGSITPRGPTGTVVIDRQRPSGFGKEENKK
jgi:serine/threonine-protein kinase